MHIRTSCHKLRRATVLANMKLHDTWQFTGPRATWQDVNRKWRETKQQPSLARSDHQLGCCLVSLHFLCAILSGGPVVRISLTVMCLCLSQHRRVTLLEARRFPHTPRCKSFQKQKPTLTAGADSPGHLARYPLGQHRRELRGSHGDGGEGGRTLLSRWNRSGGVFSSFHPHSLARLCGRELSVCEESWDSTAVDLSRADFFLCNLLVILHLRSSDALKLITF